MEIADILTETLKREDREALLNLHRHLHGLAAQGEVDCDRLTKAHELVAAEIVRRGYVHGSELECGKQKGLVLPAPHAFLVWKGKQTAVAASPEFHAACGAKAVDVPLALVCEGEAYGLVTLGTPAVMDCKTFDLPEFTEEHRVRPEERREWWPEAEKLFVYPIRDFQGFKELQRVDASGDGLCEVRYKQYQPPSEREATVLRQSEKLPKVIVLQPHAVSLTGSVLYGKHEPADTDVVLVGAEWREGEGQFVVPLTPTFKEKLERVLKAVYQTGNPVQYISEGTGATFDHLPLYSLALVRLPRLEVERVSELESEFAEVGYDKQGVKYSPDQPRDESGRFGGGGGSAKVAIGRLSNPSDAGLIRNAAMGIPSADLESVGPIGTERPFELDLESETGWRYSGMEMEGQIVAAYDQRTGEVRIHPNALRSGSELLNSASETPSGILAHEVAHSVYQNRLGESEKESLRYLNSQLLADFADGTVSEAALEEVGLRPYALYRQGQELYSELYRVGHTRSAENVGRLDTFLSGYRQDLPWKGLIGLGS